MNDSDAFRTYSVQQLCQELQDVLRQAWPSIWVTGEVQRPRPHRNGHLYLELVDKGAGDAVDATLSAVIWRGRMARIRSALDQADLEISEGIQLRCFGSLDFYPPHGRVQFIIEDIDPVFTEGRLERRRRETLKALSEAGLLERNRALPLSELPLHVGLVTSEGSAAFHDFLASLAESRFPFRVLFVHSLVQGRGAERQLVEALRALGDRPLDCIAVIRGGGSRSDLSVFDSRAVAEAVATCPLPVLTGLGHEIDVSIADRVAHTWLKTPTGVGEFLVHRVSESERRVQSTARRLAERSSSRILHARRRVERAGRVMRAASHRIAASQAKIDRLSDGLRRLAKTRLRHAGRRIGEMQTSLVRRALLRLERGRATRIRRGDGVVRSAQSRLVEARTRLDGWDRLISRLSPERTLARGFSITRAVDGGLIRESAQTPRGSKIETELHRGRLISRVEEA